MARIRGFTLIEIMVVMLIIGVILSIAIPSINFSNPEDKLNEEINRLTALVDLASQESILNSKIIGIRAKSDQYEFLVLEGNKWQSLDDKLLSKRKLPGDMKLEVIIDDYNSSNSPTPSGTETVTPQITLLDSGELEPPFVINIKSQSTDLYFSLKGYANGKLEKIKHSNDQ